MGFYKIRSSQKLLLTLSILIVSAFASFASAATPVTTVEATQTAAAYLTMLATLNATQTPILTIVPTVTKTPTVTSTATPTFTSSSGLTKTPTPNSATLLDGNLFNPNQGPLGMDVRMDVAGRVKITVYNILGERVAGIYDRLETARNFRVAWDGHNEKGDMVGNAVYFIVTQTPSSRVTRKVIVIK